MRTVTSMFLALILSLGSGCADHPRTTRLVCGSEVTVDRDEIPSCDMVPPATLNVTGLSEDECDASGGVWSEDEFCADVDY